MTHWVAEAWTSLHEQLEPITRCPFKRSGITVAINGSGNSEISIRGLKYYSLPVLEDYELDSMNPLQSGLQLDMEQAVDGYASLSSYTASNLDGKFDSDTSDKEISPAAIQQQQERGLQ